MEIKLILSEKKKMMIGFTREPVLHFEDDTANTLTGSETFTTYFDASFYLLNSDSDLP